MAKSSVQESFIFKALVWLVFLSLLVPLIFTSNLLYPFISTKALLIRVVVSLALPLYAYLLVKDKNNRPNFKNPVTLSLLAFVVLSLDSTIFGQNSIRSFWGNYERMDGMFQTLHLTLLYFYLLYLCRVNSAYARRFLYGVVIVSFITSLYGVLEPLGLKFFVDASMPGRVSSTFGNPIFLASYLIIPIFLAGFLALQEQDKWSRRFLWLAMAIQILAVFLSQTRGAVVGLVAGIIIIGFYYLISSKAKRIRNYGLVSLAAFILVFASLFYVGRHFGPASSLGRVFNLNDSNSKARLIQWESGIKGFKDHPLLGVGPENYNIIANKYFNPEIYKYDASWFDKPHNYQLEILLTRGVAGLLAYLALIVFTVWAFWKACQTELITKLEFCFLLAAVLVYQIQNIFVFDTTAAAWAFFVFTAFAAFLSEEERGEQAASDKRLVTSNNILGYVTMGVLGALTLYQVFVFDITTIKVLYNLNIAYAIGVNNPELAEQYFQKTLSQSFIYDPGDVGTKYGEFAVAIAQDQADSLDHNFINKVLDHSTAVLQATTAKISNNPIYWFHLANDYDTKSVLNKTGVDPRARTAVNNAIALAGSRIEPKFFLIQIYGLENNLPQVLSLSEEIANDVPFNAEAQWRLALAYKDNNMLDQAVAKARQAIAMGYQFQLVEEFKWLINYYADKQDYAEVASLYQQAVKLSPSDYQLYASLATAYAKLGEKDQAIAAAEKVLQLNPASKASVDAFIQSLQ